MCRRDMHFDDDSYESRNNRNSFIEIGLNLNKSNIDNKIIKHKQSKLLLFLHNLAEKLKPFEKYSKY